MRPFSSDLRHTASKNQRQGHAFRLPTGPVLDSQTSSHLLSDAGMVDTGDGIAEDGRKSRGSVVSHKIGHALRSLAVAMAIPVMGFWAVFAANCYPWLVPADHNADYLRAYTEAFWAGTGMVGLTLAGMLISAGVFGKRRAVRWAAVLIGGGVVAVSPWLYPAENLRFPQARVVAQFFAVAVAGSGATGLWLTRTRS